MEKYLVPETVGEGYLSDQWTRFKKECSLFLLAIGKADASGGMKLVRAVGVVSCPDPMHRSCTLWQMNIITSACCFANNG